MQSQPPLKQYSYRFIIAILYATSTFINGMCWVVVTPISTQIQKAYDIPSNVISLIPMSYMIFYVFINFPSNWVLDVKGIKKGIVVGSVLTLLGTGVRSMVKYSFAFVLIGQFICAIAQPFLLNAPMKIATRWFKQQNRSLALSLLIVVNIIGTAVGFLIPPLFVSDTTTNSNVQDQFFTLLVFQFFIALLSTILILIFFKEGPPTLPSLGSMVENVEFKKSVKILFTDRNFLGLTLAFATVNGNFNIYGSLMGDILDPYNYSSDQVSWLGVALMVSGIISATLIGLYVQKTLKYHRVFILCSIIGIITCIGFPLCLKILNDQFWIFMILIVMQGMVFIPLQPLSIDYSCDTMFPIGQAQISGFLITGGQILGIVFVVIAQNLFGLGEGDQQSQQNSAFNSVLFCNSFLALGGIIMFFQNGELKRAKLQLEKDSLMSEQPEVQS